MNQDQRRRIQEIVEELELQITLLDNIREEEEDKIEMLPENLQNSSRADQFQENADALEQCVDDLNSLIDSLNDLL